MDIEFSCSQCGQSMVVDEAGAGLEIPCPKCQTTVTVPSPTTPEPALASDNGSQPAPAAEQAESPQEQETLLLTQICLECDRAWPEHFAVCDHCGTFLREIAPAAAAMESAGPSVALPRMPAAPMPSAEPTIPVAPRTLTAPAGIESKPVGPPRLPGGPRVPSAPRATETAPPPSAPPPEPTPAPAPSATAGGVLPSVADVPEPDLKKDEYQCMNPSCGTTWYANQLATQQIGRKSIQVCPRCRLGVSKIRKQLNFWKVVPGAFVYPFKGAGGWILGFGCLLAAFLNVGGMIGGFIIFIIAMLFFFGFFGMLLINTIRSTADDPSETLDWPELTGFGEIVMTALRWLVATLLVFGPAIICYYVASQSIEDDYGQTAYGSRFGSSFAGGGQTVWSTWWGLPVGFLVILGVAYYPMALMAVAMFDSWKGVNPMLVMPPIFKLPVQYAVIVALIGGMVLLRNAIARTLIGEEQIWGALMGHGDFGKTCVAYVFMELFALYCMIVSARLLGLLYKSYEEKIGWFE